MTATTATPSHSIVVAVDGSAPSDRALAWACEEAARLHRPLHVLHANAVAGQSAGSGALRQMSQSATEQLKDELRQVLDQAVRKVHQLAPRLQVTSELVGTAPARAIVEASSRAHTVVLGGRGHGPLSSLLLGSVSTQVSMHAHCPVVVIKDVEDVDRPRDGVVVGVDGVTDSQPALAFAFEQAAARGTGLDVVHAWVYEQPTLLRPITEPIMANHEMTRERELLVSEIIAGWGEKYPDVSLSKSVVNARPVDALLQHSDGAQLLVVGARGRGGFTGLVLGSVSHALLQRAGAPVAVVRGDH
jgi:nucleotide-binding universal stress UspA family protein